MVRVKTFLFMLLFASVSQAQPLGTAFTYQGELKHLGGAANGTFDFQFELFDSSVGGTSPASPVLLDDVSVVEGVFTVQLDFGPVFSGDASWLEIQVREGASTDGYTVLDPRQEITPTPNALHAEGVAVDSVGSPEISNNTVAAVDLAADSVGVSEIISSEVQQRVSVNCPPGSSIRSIAQNGTVTCESDTDSGGDITSVTADTGLTGGALSGPATLSVDLTQVQARVSNTCGAGTAVTAIAQDGTATCTSVSTPHDPFGGVLMVHPADFEEDRGHQNSLLFNWSRSFQGYMVLSASAGTPPIEGFFQAPVHLPAGATVTQVVAYYYDNDVDLDENISVSVSLRKRTATQTSHTVMASAFGAQTSGASDTILVAASPSISDAVISNDAFYWLSLSFNVWGTNGSLDLRFYGARIEYTMP